LADTETWRDQSERRFQLGRDQARTMLATIARELPAVVYTEGSRRTLVVTTYFDSPTRDYLRMVVESGGRTSVKVRLREYLPLVGDGDDAEIVAHPTCHLERKERIGEVRQKHRIKLDKKLVGAVLRREVGLRGDPDVVSVLDAELALRALEPVLVSVYERWVFGSDRDGLRVTFDERLRFHVPPAGMYDDHAALTPEVLGPAMAPGPPRILELKDAAGRATPPWLAAMLRGVPDLESYSKFRDGMSILGSGKLGQARLTRPLTVLKSLK
jgi:hypothetical protein